MNSAFMHVVDGDASGTRIEVDGEVVLGREGDVAALFEDEELSRRHARVIREPDGSLAIEDLGSANGTFVNGRRIGGRMSLSAGDAVRIGATTLEVRRDEAALETVGRGSSAPTNDTYAPVPMHQPGSPTSIRRVHHERTPSNAVLVHGSHTIPIPLAGLTAGRDAGSDVALPTELASRTHARVGVADGRYYVADLGSVNGTYLNGEVLFHEARWLSAGDTISVGDEHIRFLVGSGTGRDAERTLDPGVGLVRFEGPRLTIGRDALNDVQLDAPTISRFHAEVVSTAVGLELARSPVAERNAPRRTARRARTAARRSRDKHGAVSADLRRIGVHPA